MKVYMASTVNPINFNYLAIWAQQKCGVSLNPLGITDPRDAMAAYLDAFEAFPEAASGEVNKLYSKCYGLRPGIVNESLAHNYGLLYPTVDNVFGAVRNGLSPNCRRYQIRNLFIPNENGVVRADRLFERWLFWKDAGGAWAPYNPPSAPEYLGKYGNHEFWTSSPACLSDFIVLAINSTANSHAAAQNVSKPTGPTSAVPGT
jgi:hypothetical protein